MFAMRFQGARDGGSHTRAERGEFFAAAGDVLRQSLRPQTRSDAVEPGLMRAQIGDEARAQALGGAVEALLWALQESHFIW